MKLQNPKFIYQRAFFDNHLAFIAHLPLLLVAQVIISFQNAVIFKVIIIKTCVNLHF